LDDVNEALAELRDGKVIGRMVLVLDADEQLHHADIAVGEPVGEE